MRHIEIIGWLLLLAGCTPESTGDPGTTGGTTGASGGGGGPGGSGGNHHTGGSGGTTTRCSVDSDCTLVADCCNCVIVRAGTPPPVSCEVVCDANLCQISSVQVTQADVGCWNGFCAVMTAPGQCNAAEVTCNAIKPTCPAGYNYPSVINGCWGPCVVNGSCLSTGG